MYSGGVVSCMSLWGGRTAPGKVERREKYEII